ncbi:MAG: hypothetical protein IIC29_04635 [Chloroflexi bacterium]|nr:hypothetical protein [Chloroflexota bacterium]MCH8235395.1 hypothetical protein [Chloroflexota bacterium]
MFTGRSRLLIAALALTALVIAACGGSRDTDGVAASATALKSGTPGATVQPVSGPSSPGAATLDPAPAPAGESVVVPDFELPRAGGGTVRLSDVYSRANTVLVFYRGYF